MAELIDAEDRFRSVRKTLKSIDRIDADKLAGTIISLTSTCTVSNDKGKARKNRDPAKDAEYKITLVLQLRQFVRAVPILRNALGDEGGCQSAMLKSMTKILDDERLVQIDSAISDSFTEQGLTVD